MKAFSIIWGILAAFCLAAVFTGHTHHWVTAFASIVMCIAWLPEQKEEERHGNR